MANEVSCPGCGSKLKAPDTMAGKKAKCKKCGTSFRIPGSEANGDSVGDPRVLSVADSQAIPAIDDDPFPMAPAADAPPVDAHTLPSADPFDFASPPVIKPPAPKITTPAAKVSPPPPLAPKVPTNPVSASRPAFGSARTSAASTPAAKAQPAAPSAPSVAKKPIAEPEPEVLSLDDAESLDDEPLDVLPVPTTAPAPESDFSFDAAAPSAKPEAKSKGRRAHRDDEDDAPRTKGKAARRDPDEDDDEPQEGRRYVRPDQKKKGGTLLVAIVLGLAALGAAVTAVVVYTQQRAKDAEIARQEQEEKDRKEKEKQEELAKANNPTPKVDDKGGKGGDGTPDKKDNSPPKKGPVDNNPKQVMLALAPATSTFRFRFPGANLELAHKVTGSPVPVEAPPAKVKRVFAPANRREQDVVAVWQSNAGLGGKGEKYTADVHSGNAGNRVGRIEFDGDGKDLKCDVSPDGTLFAAVGPDDKVTVWKLADGTKTLDAYDPFGTDKSDHKAAGLAAVFFTADPANILTVTTAGAMHLHEMAGKKSIASFGPLGILSPNKVVMGKNVAPDATRTSVVVAVNGTIYQRDTARLAAVSQIELGGEVGRPLGIAVLGMPGRIAYAFETDAEGKKEKAVLFALAKEPLVLFRWPESPGEPTGANWAGERFAVIATEKGAVYVHSEDKKFTPFAFAELATGKSSQTANENGHWYLNADLLAPGRSTLVELTTDELTDFHTALEGMEPPTVRIDEKGLSK